MMLIVDREGRLVAIDGSIVERFLFFSKYFCRKYRISCPQWPEEIAADDMALNFRCAVPDTLYTGVAPEAL